MCGCEYNRDRTSVARCCAIESVMSLWAARSSVSKVIVEIVSSGRGGEGSIAVDVGTRGCQVK